MGKQGRPRALNLNGAAVNDVARIVGIKKGELAQGAGMSAAHLSNALNPERAKGVSEETVRRLAEVLGCDPATIAPELHPLYRAVRPQDADVA